MRKEQRPPSFPPLAEKLYFTIGEVSEWCGVEQHVLRYWEQVFRKLKPVRRGGRRFYTPNDLLTIKKIYQLLKCEGYTIEGAKRKLNRDEHRRKGVYDARLMGAVVREEVVRELQAILKIMD